MSTKHSLYYDAEDDVHLYREMLSNDIYLQVADKEAILIPAKLGKLLLHIDFDELEWKVNNL